MIIASCITFFGACRSAIELYEKIFPVISKEMKTFAFAGEAFASFLTPENREYILEAKLSFSCGTTIVLKDSFTMMLSPAQAGSQGNKDNVIYDVYGLTKEEIQSIYREFTEHGATVNVPLSQRDGHLLYASVIDPFIVCWNLYCDEE